jgi:hypothetical protein
MLVLKTESLGDVRLGFRHQLPSIQVKANNRLSASTFKVNRGRTLARLVLDVPDYGMLEIFGESVCHPTDSYDKEAGRVLALERALDSLKLTPKEYREVMSAYYAR